ncbi:hypothetical protein FPQ18DRAFT_392726 [Pyronema domesticum]|nr:hypothetical protein FPQ18DRAFT_392726 [Pyronema domesticum]
MTIPTDATAITTSGPTIAAGAKTAQSTALAPADFGPAAANTIASTTAASIVTASATTTATKSAAATGKPSTISPLPITIIHLSDPAPTANPVLSFSTASSLPTDHAYSLNFYLNQSRSEDAIRIFNLPSRSMASVESVTDPTV